MGTVDNNGDSVFEREERHALGIIAVIAPREGEWARAAPAGYSTTAEDRERIPRLLSIRERL